MAQGHRRIAMISNAALAYTSSRQRLDGYRQALEQADLAYDEQLVQYGNFDEESGQAAMEALLAIEERPTAVFIASDMVAMGALWTIRDQGLRVPEEVAVVGFDDITAARFITPALTTIHIPTFGLGWSAAELLIRIIEQDTPERTQVLLDTELVIRESCGAAKSI
jgi:DNA-binding LacI/PurR family transcriptional regulator